MAVSIVPDISRPPKPREIALAIAAVGGTQRMVARRMGVSDSYMSRVVNGLRAVSPAQVARIATTIAEIGAKR